MADINIISRKGSKLSWVQIDGTATELDASLSEDHTLDSELTEFPVENGSVISDHRVVKPEGVVVEGIISKTPVSFLGGAFGLLESEKDIPNEWAKVKKIFKDGEKMTVNTGLETYTDMILTKLSTPRDAKTGQALVVKATYQKLIYAVTEIRDLEANLSGEDKALQSLASSVQDTGSSTPAATQTSGTSQSWAKSFFGFF